MSKEYPKKILPPPLVSGYGYTQKSSLTRTAMDSGLSRQRPIFDGVPASCSLSFVYSKDELEVFEGWFEYKIDKGACWFSIDLEVGNPQKKHNVRTFGTYKVNRYTGDLWKVSFEVEIEQINKISPDMLDLRLDGVTVAELEGWGNRLHQLVNYDLSGKRKWYK